MSEWNGRDIYLAFRYTAKKGQKQEGYTISSFNLNNTVETDALPYTIWTNASFAKCGTTTNKLQEDQTGAIFPLISGHLEHRLLVQACLTVRRILKAG